MIRNRLLATLSAGLMTLSSLWAATPELRYVDADTLTVINRAAESGPVWQRVDVDRYPDLTPKVREYYSFPTGMAVAFATNATTLYARWKTAGRGHGVNSTLINQSGLALYIRQDGKWIYAGVGKPKYNKTRHLSPLVSNMADTLKECLLYLPIYDGIDSLQIGVNPGAKIHAIPNPFGRKRVVVMGSSITHGSAVSNPAMAYPARLERMLDMEMVNLGASGQCKLEPFFAQVAADCRADAFIFDVFSNPSAEQIRERLVPFVAAVRKAHPDIPLIFLQTLRRESTNFDQSIAAFEAAKREAASEEMAKVLGDYTNVYFIDPGMPVGDDHEATVDGVHPTDLGFERILTAILPQLSAILNVPQH